MCSSEFLNEARSTFRHLEALGFQELDGDETQLRYARADLVIEIYRGRQSYELGLNLVRRGVSYSLERLLRANPDASSIASEYRTFAATTPAAMRNGLAMLAATFDACAALYLTSDPTPFAVLERQGRETSASRASDVSAAILRPEADAAFRARDYAKAATLYEQMLDRLSTAELKKLEYAKAHSADTPGDPGAPI